MVILYPPPTGVKCARPFGAGILPADAPGADQPFEPTPEDRAWWAAESERIAAARRAHRPRRGSDRPVWLFSRSDRSRALIGRARAMETYLLRERCDATGPAARAALGSRLAIVARRIRRLSVLARESRRLDRHFDVLATETAATAALERGLIPADVAEMIARTSIVGHDA